MGVTSILSGKKFNYMLEIDIFVCPSAILKVGQALMYSPGMSLSVALGHSNFITCLTSSRVWK